MAKPIATAKAIMNGDTHSGSQTGSFTTTVVGTGIVIVSGGIVSVSVVVVGDGVVVVGIGLTSVVVGTGVSEVG